MLALHTWSRWDVVCWIPNISCNWDVMWFHLAFGEHSTNSSLDTDRWHFFPHPCILFTTVNDISTWQHNDIGSKQTDKAFTSLPSSKIQESLACIGWLDINPSYLFSFVVWRACHIVPVGTIYDSSVVTCWTIELSRTISKMGLSNRIHCSLLSLLICDKSALAGRIAVWGRQIHFHVYGELQYLSWVTLLIKMDKHFLLLLLWLWQYCFQFASKWVWVQRKHFNKHWSLLGIDSDVIYYL